MSLLGFSGSWDVGFRVSCFNSASEFGDVVKEGEHLVVVFLRDWVVFMIVAAGAAHRKTEENGACGINAVDRVFEQEFLGNEAGL